jgi:hypothetical protein
MGGLFDRIFGIASRGRSVRVKPEYQPFVGNSIQCRLLRDLFEFAVCAEGRDSSDVRGTNNLDSVAFDAESNTIDNQDGHNAFQDVKLNGLILTGDHGDTAKAYAAAGLGCSDSLRLLGMTNVTMMNSVLFDEAGCHTKTGTAAVILGRVSHVTFVNNIIFGVPASGSPDETGIDFEWSEDHVNLLANLFAGNAGPAVEILNIHRGDHSSDLDFSSNTFAQNAHARQPGAAGVWEDNKGRGYGIPAGKIRNNLYFEPHGRFFGGRNIGLVSDVNNVGTTQAANFAAEQFSATQGENNWQYRYETADGTWANLPFYAVDDKNGAWEAGAAQYVSAFNMAPASCINNRGCGGVAREWIAPHAGTISIRGRVLRSDGQAGTGVRAAVNLVSGRNRTLIWPVQDGRQLIASTDQMGYATDLDDIYVSAGDVIRFEIHASGDRSNDAVSWTPSIGYVGSGPRNSKPSRVGL